MTAGVHRGVSRVRVAGIALCLVVGGLMSSVAPTSAHEIAPDIDPNADVHAFGVPHLGDTTATVRESPIVGMAALLDGSGYWLTASDGEVINFGAAPLLGSLRGLDLVEPIVGMAAHPGGNGYWLVASDGGVFSFGEAPYLGSLGNIDLVEPIVGMAAHPSGRGYWLVASDGGVFAFGESNFFGSMGGIQLKEPVVGMAGHGNGEGYWLVASDGGIFAFAAAQFLGSTGALTLVQPVVAMIATSDSNGYWMAAADGGIFTFGTAEFFGSAAGTTRMEPVVAMAAPAAGGGYWIARAAGPLWPLTGTPMSAPTERPALAVKIDNSPGARGQWGLANADVVIEELVEGGLTRLIAVFHSDDASPVGPIRSARETDLDLVPMFGQSLLAYSGANRPVRRLVLATESVTGIYPNTTYGRAYYRTSLRSSPHNLLSTTSRL